MAFTDLGSIASGGNSGNNQASLTVATTANCAAGELIVVVVTDDNISTGGGDTLETSGVTIGTSAPFALTKGRQNSTNLAAQAGASVSLWWGVLPYAIASGQNIVASFTNATLSDATALSARHFSFASLRNTVAVEATNATTGTTTNPTSLTATTANIACLRIRATGCEYDSTQTITTTATWTTWAEGASAATGTITEQVIECEHLISTTTSAASAPTLGSACDSASVYVAFKEVANPFRLQIFDVPRGPRRGRDFWIDAVGFVAAAAEPETEIIPADAGIYALTGSEAGFTATVTADTTNLPAGGANWFNPWGRKRPAQDWLKGPIPAVPVILTAASGSYTLTGTAATWALGHAAGSGSYTITGSASALRLRHVAGAGSYTLTGADAGLVIPGAVTYLPAGLTGGYVPWGRPYPVSLLTRTGRPLATPPPINGTLTSTQAAQTLSATGTVPAAAGLNLPAGMTGGYVPWRRPYPVSLLTRTRPLAAQPITGALTTTQAAQTLSAIGGPIARGILGFTQANHALSAIGGPIARGILGFTQANHALSAAGAIISGITGVVSVTQMAQTLSAAGTITGVVGALNTVQAAQSLTAIGRVTVGGTLGVSQANQTLNAIASSSVRGALNVPQAANALAAIGTVFDLVVGDLAAIEIADELLAFATIGERPPPPLSRRFKVAAGATRTAAVGPIDKRSVTIVREIRVAKVVSASSRSAVVKDQHTQFPMAQ